jgi:hypothetical protein
VKRAPSRQSAMALDLASLQDCVDQVTGPDAARLAKLCERRYAFENTRPQRDAQACKEWFALAARLYRQVRS